MCGIAGFVGSGNKETGLKMIEAISYRGPDFKDVFFADGVALAHARLSILDLDSRSNQPFFSDDKRYAVTFNGEIYNYPALKQALIKTGKYNFHTTSDTEVMLNAYIEYGKEFLHKIHGMFVFAIYDFHKRVMLLARDRMGKKPLYYTFNNNTFVFASELKALLCHPSVEKKLNPHALNAYLTYDYVPTPGCIIDGVHKLSAGHYLEVIEGKMQSPQSYWDPKFSSSTLSYNEAIREFDRLLEQAVVIRMMSDVPLGVFLSGGIDSSAVAWYAQKNSTGKIKTFSIGFAESSYDESSYAKMVALHIGSQHYEKILTANDAYELLPEISRLLDEPFADPSIIPTYYLSAFTRKHVTVALGGDGSDELMAGYPTFITDKYISTGHAIPPSFIRMMNHAVNLLPVSDKNISLDFKLKQFLKGFSGTPHHTHTLWLGSFTPEMKSRLFTREFKEQLNGLTGLELIDDYVKSVSDQSRFNKVLYTYFKTYLQDDILVKVDRASMYNSLEVRAPFLDTSVIDFLNSLPASYKMKGQKLKRILKDLMLPKLPEDIITRPKKGFGIPVSLWLRNELRPVTTELLSEKHIASQGIFNPGVVTQLLNEHQNKKRNHRKLLWNLLMFQLWNKNFL